MDHSGGERDTGRKVYLISSSWQRQNSAIVLKVKEFLFLILVINCGYSKHESTNKKSLKLVK